ncbi:DnaJ domain-containing protein [Acinetobacter sp. B10A]|uniref:DnaJ domain-containing protein n=1 Tax=Acinetobacter baretiae TaxID=2605383 RepID=UPI001B3C8642|nr:DnaJ domain-containing protein [Acinetobacter baretiae]MBF7684725.1 DnaJ domain-containing protein [Acinetobacter baretiae]
MVWAIIIIFIAIFFLGLLFSFWKIIVLTTIGLCLGGPVGGVIGFILGVLVSQRSKTKIKNSSDTWKYTQHQQNTHHTEVSIEWLTPIIHLVSYYAKYQDQQWTSEKVHFVKSMFTSHCKSEEDLIYLRDLLKQKNHKVSEQVDLILQQRWSDDSKLDVFKLCAQAINLNMLNERSMEQALTNLAKRLFLKSNDYEKIIHLFKHRDRQDFRDYSHSTPSPDQVLALAYAHLNVSRHATKDEVVKAYRIQMMRCHPDKHPTATVEEKEKLTEKSIQLQQAKDLIVRYLEKGEYSR